MRKQSMRSLKLEMDNLAKAITLTKRPNCLICNNPADHAHHLLTKKFWGHMRWHLENLIPLCRADHFRLHKDPFLPHLKIHREMGPEWIGRLMTATKGDRKPFSRKELQLIRTALVAIATALPESDVLPADGAGD